MTWEEYKANVRATDPDVGGAVLDEAEAQSAIITAIIQRRNELGLSQRELADMCEMPQSSIARLESCQVNPSVSTALRVLRQLGLTLTVRKAVKES